MTKTVMSAHKTWVAAIGGLLTIVIPLLLQVATFLPPPWPSLIGGVVALLTVIGVYQIPNKPLTPSAPPQQPPPAGPGGYPQPWG